MKPTTSENALFELALFILTSARTVIDEPKRYGPRRLLDTLERFVNLSVQDPRVPDDPFFENVRRKIAERPELRTSSVVFSQEFRAFLDSLIIEFVDEMMKRRL